MPTCTCGTTYGGSCCPSCQPANVIYQGECTDPGTLTTGRFLSVLDFKFCERRLASGTGGFLVSNINGSGNAGFTWTTTPQVQLIDYQAAENVDFGQLVVMGSDYRWRALVAPAAAGLFMQTDATGNVYFGSAPAATVPDPLAIGDLSVSNLATLNDVTTNGTVTLNNLASGTVANLLAVNAANELILQAVAAGIAGTMFYESNTSPGVATPNAAKISGEYLVIGNRLFDSGANLISVTTSESITVNVAGKYLILWQGQVRTGGAAAPAAGVWLEINGVIVNPGNGRTSGLSGTAVSTAQMWQLTGMEMRSLSANDVLRLQLSETASSVATYEVRLVAIKFAD